MAIFLKNNRGIALVVVIAVMAILLSITGASLLFSGLNLKTAGNLKTGGGAIHAADAGIQHALAVIPTGTNFTYGAGATVVSTTVFPDATSGYSYVVTATNNPSTSASTSTAILTSTGNGPNGSKRVIQAYIGRSTATGSWIPPGSVYVPGAASVLEFKIESGSIISGNDTNIDGTAGPLAAVPGIATSDAAATTEAIAAVEAGANITGAGGTPSVATSSSTLDIPALANSFLTNSHTTLAAGTYENYTFGTWASPQITHITGEGRFRGNSSGAGVLIVDGKLRLEDTFNFQGLIILRNGGELRLETGANSPIYGAILIAPGSTDIDAELDWRGGGIKYSSQAIGKVTSSWPGALALPQPAKLIAWQEVMQ